MDNGYLKLFRKIQDHPFYKERRQFSKLEAWIDILFEVRYIEEPEDVMFGMKVISCGYGESLNSIMTWAKRWKWSESKVRRFFILLKKLNQIDLKSEGQTTRLTVLNYSKYNKERRASEKVLKDTRRASDEHSTTEEERKKEKKDNKEKKKIKKKPSLKTYLQEKIIEHNFISIKDKIFEFYNYRQSLPTAKRYKTEKGLNALFRDLVGCSKEGLLLSDCLEEAMEREWLTPNPTYFKNNGFGKNSRQDENKAACAEFINDNKPDSYYGI